jgi:Lrp/AsnC family transcriptional regulator, regulator for asnA, asnC and gidA
MEDTIRPQYNDNLDDIDRHIIEAMRQDGRVAFAQIAKKLNVSPGMIRVRYNRMVKIGLIRVVAITNPLRMGYTTMTMIGIRTEGDKMLSVAQKVAEFDEVIYLIVVSGRYDIIAEVVCRDHADLLRFLTEKLYRVEGVRESETFVHLKIEKEVYY